jgi:hypothetical protein
MIAAALGQSTREFDPHHWRMKGHHSTSLQKPIQENRDVTVTGENFWLQSDAGIQMRKKLDRTKASAGTEDCIQVRPAEEGFKVASPLLVVTCQVPFSIINPRSQLDFESLGAHSLNAGRQPFIIDAAGGCDDPDPSAPP